MPVSSTSRSKVVPDSARRVRSLGYHDKTAFLPVQPLLSPRAGNGGCGNVRWRRVAIAAQRRVDDAEIAGSGPAPTAVLGRGVERTLAPKERALVDEVNRIIEATYRVISRTETLDPPLREILREAGLSTPAFYRHFRSKDELLVGLVEQGWARLRGYLAHQMEKASDPATQIAAWVRGMLAQAADLDAARRARPFTVNLYRLATQFPDEYRASRDSLIALLVAPVQQLRGPGRDVEADVMAVYTLVKAAQDRHLVERTVPARAEVEHLVEFVLAALTAT
jgi:AcrR family transcriptional regulator